MEIKIVGSNFKNGMQLYKIVNRAIEEQGNFAKIEKLDDKKDILKYGVKNIPGLVVNDSLVSEGRVLSQREFEKIISKVE